MTYDCRAEKGRKETLFKCQVYLALRHTNWGHCKLKLIQIKLNEMQVFEERGKHLRAEQTQPTYDTESGKQTRATLVGGDCSHHYATTALQNCGAGVDEKLKR